MTTRHKQVSEKLLKSIDLCRALRVWGAGVRCNAFLPDKLWEVKMAELGGGGGKRWQTGPAIVADSGVGIS